jgi:hypothetical protein
MCKLVDLPVQMNGVGERGVLLAHLDEPVGPGTLVRNLDDGVGIGVANVVLKDVLKGRFVPVDHHSGGVQMPKGDVLAVCGKTGGNASAEGLDLGGPLGLVDCLSPVRNGDKLTTAVGRRSFIAVCGLGGRNARVGEQSTTVVVITTETICGCLSTEEVVARSLVGGEDDIVSLANGKQDPVLSGQGLGGNEISRDDGEVVAVKLDTNGIVDRGVDQSQAMFLALGKSHLGIRSGTCLVLSQTVHENIVTVRWRCVVLEILQSDVVDVVCKTIVPIADGESAKIDIVVRSGRAVDYNSASNTHTILR